LTDAVILRLLAPLGVLACVAVPAALAVPVHPRGLPLTFTLPSGWVAGGASDAARFTASGASGKLAVTTGGSFPMSLPFSSFVATETAAAEKAYRAEDPHAVVTGKKVVLPSGPAVRITATVSHGGAPTAIDLYSLLHKGVTYHFTYFTSKPQLKAALPGFTSSARSIRWAS
jgi:hypothetical protein